MALPFVGKLLSYAKPKYNHLGTTASYYHLQRIGKREVVGSGLNNTECYADMTQCPMPAVRFREPSKESACLQAKEQLHWGKLSLQEKKALYRHSFCQTFTEMKAGSGEWKFSIGIVLLLCSIGIWWQLFCQSYLYDELPESYSDECKKAQLKRMLDLQVNPIFGLSSKWDYENNRWKK